MVGFQLAMGQVVLGLVIICLLLAKVFIVARHAVALLWQAGTVRSTCCHVSRSQVLLEVLIVREVVFIVLLNFAGKAAPECVVEARSSFLKLISWHRFVIGS